MAFKYIYSASRIKTLSYNLLSENQLERLLGAKSQEEAFKTLQDTFLESFVYAKVQDISKPMEDCVYQAKTLLGSIAPDQKMISILWIEFDFFNLKIIAKGRKNGLETEEIKKHATFTGNYTFERLLKAYDDKKLGTLNKYFKEAVEESQEKQNESQLDLVFDRKYLENLVAESKSVKDKFMKEFVLKMIDLFNLKTALRLKFLESQNVPVRDLFVPGGKISKKDLEDETQLNFILNRFGNGKKWQEAFEEYKKSGNFSLIEKASEEHLLDFLKRKSLNMFSPATLFSYFYRLKNNLHIIRTIILGKEMGLSELEIRNYLKKLY